MKVMISLDKKFLENNKEEAIRKHNEMYNDTPNLGYCFEFEIKNDGGVDLIDSDGEITLSGGINYKNDVNSSIYIIVSEKPSILDLIKISEMVVKNFNKVKSFFETMK